MNTYEFIKNTLAFFIKQNLSGNKKGFVFSQNNVCNESFSSLFLYIYVMWSKATLEGWYLRENEIGSLVIGEILIFCENLEPQEIVIVGKVFTSLPSTYPCSLAFTFHRLPFLLCLHLPSFLRCSDLLLALLTFGSVSSSLYRCRCNSMVFQHTPHITPSASQSL